MKKIQSLPLLIVLLAGVITLLSFMLLNSNKKKQNINMSDKGFAVIELFTSEGCSSCPAAEAVVADLLSKEIKDVYILSYHVDYWDRLWWKDMFSDKAFSERQRLYARHLSLDGVYTPQIVVNGTTEFVGSNVSALNNAVNKNKNTVNTSNLHISAIKKDNVAVVSYQIEGGETMLLNTAAVLPQADTKVKGGENGGRTLHHVNIVAGLKVEEVKNHGEISIEIPTQLIGKSVKIIAYTQDKKSFKVLGADEVVL